MTSGKSNYKSVLKKAKADTKVRLDKALQNTAVEAISRMIDRTPVDTGAAKYHWFVRAIPTERFDKTRVDPSGQQPKQRAKRDIKQYVFGRAIVWLVNAAPYFVFLEHGSSKQAPSGVVAITIGEMGLLWRKWVQVAFSRDPRA